MMASLVLMLMQRRLWLINTLNLMLVALSKADFALKLLLLLQMLMIFNVIRLIMLTVLLLVVVVVIRQLLVLQQLRFSMGKISL